MVRHVLRAGRNSPPAVWVDRPKPASALAQSRVSRSGEMPEPTVTVRMKESGCFCQLAGASFCLGSREGKGKAVTQIEIQRTGAIAGPLHMIAAGAVFAGANTAVQMAGMTHGAPAPTIAFWQYAIALLVALPLVINGGWRTDALGWHIMRVALAAVGVQLWVMGLAIVPIWQAIALILTSPLFVTLGAAVFLKETLTPARLGAVIVGGSGGVIILAPWTDAFQWQAILPIGAALFWAASSLVTKRLSSTERASTLTLYLLVLLVPINASFAIGTGFVVSAEAMSAVLIAGLLTGLAQYMLARAYCLSDASYLQPFDHLKLPLNVGLGVLVFGFAPPGLMWLGAAIIVAATAWLLRDEA